MNEPDESTWKTNNLSLAAYLRLLFPVTDVTWEDSPYNGSCFWHFDDSEDLADAVADFVGGLARVDPKLYNETYGSMKKEVFSVKQRQAS